MTRPDAEVGRMGEREVVYLVNASDYEYHAVVAIYKTRKEADAECAYCKETSAKYGSRSYFVTEQVIGESHAGVIVNFPEGKEQINPWFSDDGSSLDVDAHGVQWNHDGKGGMAFGRSIGEARAKWRNATAARRPTP